MDFQEEPGRIFAMRDGTLVAEITFPEQDGVAVFDHTFVDGSLRGRAEKRVWSAPMPEAGLQTTRRRPICWSAEESAFAAFRT